MVCVPRLQPPMCWPVRGSLAPSEHSIQDTTNDSRSLLWPPKSSPEAPPRASTLPRNSNQKEKQGITNSRREMQSSHIQGRRPLIQSRADQNSEHSNVRPQLHERIHAQSERNLRICAIEDKKTGVAPATAQRERDSAL